MLEVFSKMLCSIAVVEVHLFEHVVVVGSFKRDNDVSIQMSEDALSQETKRGC